MTMLCTCFSSQMFVAWSLTVEACTHVPMYQCFTKSVSHILNWSLSKSKSGLSRFWWRDGCELPIPLPVAGPFGSGVKPRNAFPATLYTHYICTWNNFETRMELQIAKVSLKWRYIDIDRISAPLKDIHCITQVEWSHDEDMLFDTNCSSFLIRTNSKARIRVWVSRDSARSERNTIFIIVISMDAILDCFLCSQMSMCVSIRSQNQKYIEYRCIYIFIIFNIHRMCGSNIELHSSIDLKRYGFQRKHHSSITNLRAAPRRNAMYDLRAELIVSPHVNRPGCSSRAVKEAQVQHVTLREHAAVWAKICCSKIFARVIIFYNPVVVALFFNSWIRFFKKNISG